MKKNHILKSLLDNNKFLIASHRGYRVGNIVENTTLSTKTALISGADIIECDLSITKDKKIYLFHNGEEKRLLNVNKKIEEMFSDEVETLRYYNNISNISDYKIESLEFYLKEIEILRKNFNFLVNIDRAWNFLEILLKQLDDFNLSNVLIIKTPLKKEFIDILRKHKIKYMYLALIKDDSDFSLLDEIVEDENINYIGIEFSGNIQNTNLLKRKFKNAKIKWINALRLSKIDRLFKEYDDDNSIINYPDTGWIKLYNLGFNTIQTDLPGILKKVRDLEEIK